MSSEPAPLRDCTTAPKELCDLVHRMLDKDPAVRPGAIEVRQIARAIAVELSSAYAEFEVSGVEDEALATLARPIRPRVPHLPLMAPQSMPSDEVVVVDPDSLEFGVTEMVPVVRKPRWTPEIGHVPNALAAQSNASSARVHAITPRSSRDQVSGEITLAKRR